MPTLDTIRHLEIFSAEAFGNRRVDCIGVGATGSKIASELAKLGIQNIHAWDFDTIESHNIANQNYSIGDIGKPKVTALKELILRDTGTEITAHNEKVNGTQRLGEIVFLLTDTMASRKEIFEKGIKLKPQIKLVIETRMAPDHGRVYSFNPCKPGHINRWMGTLYEDAQAQVSACGAQITVGATAQFIASLAVWQLIKWFAIETKKAGTTEVPVLENEIYAALRPLGFTSFNFPES